MYASKLIAVFKPANDRVAVFKPTHKTYASPAATINTPAPTSIPVIPPHDYTVPPITNGLVPVISRIPTKEQVVFLTIDDGIWTNPADAQVMLTDHVKATFFLVYRFIHNNPLFFSDLAQVTGSDIQNHSYDHYMLTNLTYLQQQQDICKNADIFLQWYGKRPTLFRPSGGSYNTDTLRAAAACNMRALIMWDVTVNNGSLQYRTGHSLQAGDIVLMHFRLTFKEDMDAFTAAAKAANLQPELLVDWIH